jgi:uncharacterized SAM-binding protein YcdF (DUF218 family)
MDAKLGGPHGWLSSFLAVYFVLLLFCFSLSIIQSGVWLFVGLTCLFCCCVAFFGGFTRYNYRYQRKCLKDVSIDKVVLSRRRSQGQ